MNNILHKHKIHSWLSLTLRASTLLMELDLQISTWERLLKLSNNCNVKRNTIMEWLYLFSHTPQQLFYLLSGHGRPWIKV